MKKLIKKLSAEQITELNSYKYEKGRSGTEVMRVLAILLTNDEFDSDVIKNLTKYDKKYALNLRRKYIKNGVVVLNDRKGKKPRALLTKGQKEEVLKVITTSTPKAFGINLDYWTTGILGDLINEQYNVQYKSRTPLCLIFKEARFTYHKPDKQYRARNQDAINQWIEKNKPIVESALNDEKTVVLVEDEMMLSTQTTTQKIWLPKGEFPKIDVASSRKIRCIYGALDIRSGQEYAFKKMGANSKSTCEFLNEIGKLHRGYKIILIWDNASWHKSAEVKDFLAKTSHNFYLINFPPYAPELNPQEHVWKDGRSHMTHNVFIDNIDKTSDQFVEFLNGKIFNYKFC